MTPGELAACRSALFVPGDRPDRYAKAAASGADAIVVDLEDAVAPAQKDAARASALRYLAEPVGRPGCYRILRLNALAGGDGLRDLLALAESEARPDGVMLAKCADPYEVGLAAGLLGARCDDPAIVPLVETARGLAVVEALAQAHSRVAGLMFGGIDLAGELGAEAGWEPLLYARSRVVAAAALRAIALLDAPFVDLHDLGALSREAGAARALGFTGKTAIHPRHIGAIHAAFAPSAAAVAAARATLAGVGAGGATVVDGRMADAAMLRAARRTLELAQRDDR
jgi:citrate lyase beta subunit